MFRRDMEANRLVEVTCFKNEEVHRKQLELHLKDEERNLECLRHALTQMHAEVGQHIESPSVGPNLNPDLGEAAEP